MRRAFRLEARLVCLVAALSWLGGCRPTTAAAAAAPGSDETSFELVHEEHRVHQEHDGFWWTQMGAQSAAVACFGPTLESPTGRFRPWSLVIFLPGSTEPLSCVQGLLELESNSPIVARGGGFAVELEPCPGCNWSQVTEDAQLVTRTDGIY